MGSPGLEKIVDRADRGLIDMKIPRLVNVIDVESTCWEGSPPDGEESEIIEIGVTTLDYKDKKVVETGSFLVRPVKSRIGDFCTRLTSITPEEVEENGITFEEACHKLRNEWSSKKRVFASWGDYDRIMFQRQCESRLVEYPFGRRHVNLKTLYALMTGQKEMGVVQALHGLLGEFEGKLHRAGDDSLNIALIFKALLESSSI